MADENEQEEEALTEEQRIEELEKKVSTNKIILFAVGLILIIGISVSLTSFILSAFSDDPELIDVEVFVALSDEVEELKNALEARNQEMAELQQTIPEMAGIIKNSTSTALQLVAIEQEKNNQTFLKALKVGMKDLAYMIPGSRTWYELYEEQISGVIASSEARELKLKQMGEGSVVLEELEF